MRSVPRAYGPLLVLFNRSEPKTTSNYLHEPRHLVDATRGKPREESIPADHVAPGTPEMIASFLLVRARHQPCPRGPPDSRRPGRVAR